MDNHFCIAKVVSDTFARSIPFNTFSAPLRDKIWE